MGRWFEEILNVRNAIKINLDSRQRNMITKWFTLNDLSYFFDLEESEVIFILLLRNLHLKKAEIG